MSVQLYANENMIKSLLKRNSRLRLSSKASGFTLVELLVALIVGGLISAGLLFMVVQLIQANLREAARSDTQRDLQAAIDYIARDVREAVYVYDATCLLDRPTGANSSRCPGLRNYLPPSITGTSGAGFSNGNTLTNLPVLAFWRIDPLPDALRQVCFNNRNAYTQPPPLPVAISGIPCLSGRMYTLVVYSLNRSTTGAVNRGRARIMRYELPQFTAGSISTGTTPTAPTVTAGWVDPKGRTSTGKETGFLAWPVDRASLTATALESLQGVSRREDIGGSIVNTPLTDFVDWRGMYDQSGTGVTQGRPSDLAGLVLTPANASSATDDPPRGFYVYVRGAEREGDLNQEVVIRIHGDAAGRPGIPNSPADRPRVPLSLETRVLTRGVTNKTQ
ncbi:prepilin-type N-terminal cleavage/methylation domain-containing protein [Leptolyngbya sp. AN03gr2]|uniref:prepilin-type N-terminal cleavage/methylation domain-containing protein n=1 Tax=unclassified Leptolyngbya TaxID=2650499 RepID=UPI003D31CCBC